MYQPNDGQTSCINNCKDINGKDCGAGSYCREAYPQCTGCDIGFYQPRNESVAACTSCPIGKTNYNTNDKPQFVRESECRFCREIYPDTPYVGATRTGCSQKCPIGQFVFDNTQCVQCGTADCTGCPKGYYIDATAGTITCRAHQFTQKT